MQKNYFLALSKQNRYWSRKKIFLYSKKNIIMFFIGRRTRTNIKKEISYD